MPDHARVHDRAPAVPLELVQRRAGLLRLRLRFLLVGGPGSGLPQLVERFARERDGRARRPGRGLAARHRLVALDEPARLDEAVGRTGRPAATAAAPGRQLLDILVERNVKTVGAILLQIALLPLMF